MVKVQSFLSLHLPAGHCVPRVPRMSLWFIRAPASTRLPHWSLLQGVPRMSLWFIRVPASIRLLLLPGVPRMSLWFIRAPASTRLPHSSFAARRASFAALVHLSTSERAIAVINAVRLLLMKSPAWIEKLSCVNSSCAFMSTSHSTCWPSSNLF